MIITVSNAARQDIVRQLGVSPQRVVVTLEAAHPMFRPVRDTAVLDAIRMKYGLPGGYIMAIGSADPRKNMTTLIAAYARLPQAMRDQHHLAIVWTHPYMAESIAQQIDALDLKANVHFLHHVPNEDLAPLYSGAALFAFPSRYEGFGLPLLEAMSCGTPVIAADNSSIPEIVGDAATLFSAEDTESITRAAAELLANPAARTARSRDGIRRAAAFSWDRCARETVDVYRCSVGYSPQPVANRS
jgi:glycosyltransferase involved in cell wall biosynthesis